MIEPFYKSENKNLHGKYAFEKGKQNFQLIKICKTLHDENRNKEEDRKKNACNYNH